MIMCLNFSVNLNIVQQKLNKYLQGKIYNSCKCIKIIIFELYSIIAGNLWLVLSTVPYRIGNNIGTIDYFYF